MSTQSNTTLMERAGELLEELDSHPSGIHRSIEAAMKSGDLESLQFQVTKGEGILAQHHFYESNILERDENDAY